MVIPVSRTHYTLRPSEELEESTIPSSISCRGSHSQQYFVNEQRQRPPRALGPSGFNRQTGTCPRVQHRRQHPNTTVEATTKSPPQHPRRRRLQQLKKEQELWTRLGSIDGCPRRNWTHPCLWDLATKEDSGANTKHPPVG